MSVGLKLLTLKTKVGGIYLDLPSMLSHSAFWYEEINLYEAISYKHFQVELTTLK